MDDDRMRVEFEASLDELVDAYRRSYRRSGRTRLELLESWTIAAVLSFLFAYYVSPYLPGPRACLATAFVAFVMFAFPFLFGWAVSRRIHHHCRAWLGERDSFLTEFELSPEGVWARAAGEEGTVRWEDVEGVEQEKGDVFLFLRPEVVYPVRQRAFRSDEERERFVKLAERYITERR